MINRAFKYMVVWERKRLHILPRVFFKIEKDAKSFAKSLRKDKDIHSVKVYFEINGIKCCPIIRKRKNLL